MPQLKVGEQMPDFSFCTPFEKDRTLRETAARAPKTALLFLRYYGCTLCQYDIHQFKVHYDEITAAGGQMLVVLQSDPERLAGQMTREDLPFDLICDPKGELYQKFEIRPAASMEELADAKAVEKIAAAKAAGMTHGEYEGDELQLPASFVMDQDCRLLYAHYGKTAADLPDPAQLAALLS